MNLILSFTGPVVAGLILTLPDHAMGQADAPKPPVHKPEQSALNRLKQDDRSKKALSDVIQQLRETDKRLKTSDKELNRVNAKDLKDDPAKVIESMKDKLSPEDTAELKKALESVVNSEDAKKIAEELKQKAVSSIKPKSAATTTPPEKFGPSTFDKVPAPVPVAPEVVAKVKTPGFVVAGDSIIFPPSRDPVKPERVLLPTDPRSRTYVVIGNGQVKTPSMVLDADRIEMVASAGGAGINPAPPSKKPAKSKPGDPVQPGIGGTAENEKKDAPFDRVIATGRVNLVRIVDGKSQTGKGGSMIYDKKSGTMILTDWPRAQLEGKVFVGDRKDSKIILLPNGQHRTEFCHLEGYEAPPAPAAPTPAAPSAAPVPKAKVVP